MSNLTEMYDEANRLKNEGKLAEAAAKLEELLAIDESHTLAHSALGVIYGRLQRHDDAIRHAQRVCELAPNDAFSFTAMSVIYQRAFAGTNRMEYIQMAEEAMARSRMLTG